jgi:hypothetical protein
LLMDAQKQYGDYTRSSVDYQESGSNAPEAAARVRESEAGDDPRWSEYRRFNDNLEEENAHNIAVQAMDQERRSQAATIRQMQLRAAHGPNTMNPVIEMNHEDLAEAHVSHDMPAPRIPMPKKGWPAEPPHYIAAGYPQLPEFKPFEELNWGQASRYTAADFAPPLDESYERLRENAKKQ